MFSVLPLFHINLSVLYVLMYVVRTYVVRVCREALFVVSLYTFCILLLDIANRGSSMILLLG